MLASTTVLNHEDYGTKVIEKCGSVWEDKIDYSKETGLTITLKNGHTVIGTLDYVEERGDASWIVLVGYYYDCGSTEYDSDRYIENRVDASIAIRLSDIEAVQICCLPD